MSSRGTVQYKFKSQTAVNTVQFEGASIRLADLKAEIIRSCGINKDFWSKTDLEISNAQTGEVFGADDLVGRNVAVLVRRVPQQRRAPIKSQVLEREISADAEDVGSGAATVRAPAAASASAPEAVAAAPAETKVAARTAGRFASKLICPLTGTIFEDAVITTCCGTSFSQAPLARTLKMRAACPECNTQAASVRTLPNRLLRDAVNAARRDTQSPTPARPPAEAAAPAAMGVAPAAAGVAPAVAGVAPAAPGPVMKVEPGSADGAERKRPREGDVAEDDHQAAASAQRQRLP